VWKVHLKGGRLTRCHSLEPQVLAIGFPWLVVPGFGFVIACWAAIKNKAKASGFYASSPSSDAICCCVLSTFFFELTPPLPLPFTVIVKSSIRFYSKRVSGC